MSNIFFTADTHWGHKNILDYCERPFVDIDDHDETLIDNWNSVVNKNDIVYHLGDIAFKNSTSVRDLLLKLNGKKHLIMGNHDHKIRRIRNMSSYITTSDVKMLKLPNGKQVFLSHYAHRVWPHSHHEVLHLYGHTHGDLTPIKNSIDVGIDGVAKWLGGKQCDYRPIEWKEVLEYIKYKQTTDKDIEGQLKLWD